jgi:hypothetical protein
MIADESAGAFIRRWTEREGGAERANYQLFLSELCDLIGVERPRVSGANVSRNNYVFERAVRFRHDDGTTSPGRIDLYKKGCFVLEAKQSRKRLKGGEVYEQLAFALEPAAARGRGGTAVLERPRAKAKAAPPLSSWDTLMRAARRQAEDYARALDEWPPFLIVVDVGHVIELYADFSRQGKNYAQFPDRNAFRIRIEDLRSEKTRARLKAIWETPLALDPARYAAEVTQEIAALLARMTQTMERRAPAQTPEAKAEWAYKISKFLMRCIFAMFAEDIGLLPKGGFLRLIELHKGKANRFHLAAESFFATMDKGGYAPAIQADIKRFNGGLFREAITVEITEDELTLLEKAARRDWHRVEPAIFGTLLEQALSERERAKLGAHHTPRAYVERLVVPTVIEPLREDWDTVQTDAIGKLLDGDAKASREVVKKFHDALCDTRVLDPACGTGNFLYVAMELMKRLEGEVLDFLKELGEAQEPLRTVDPHQFLGLELNPRAVPIAELVLWIGYIQWWFRTRERQVITEPILRDFGTIKSGDAVLAYDGQELLRDERGRPITRQNPHAVKLHPITGEEVPDPDARLEVYRYVNPRAAQWPEAEFIVGNPPFIGGKDLRAELGDGYTQALWASRGKKSDSIDFVMYWWDHAARLLARDGTKLRRFGFITTNSITQKFSRRVLEKHLKAEKPISLIFAVPDHPWQKAPRKAAVRIAMTVAEKGERVGRLAEVVDEGDLETDQPRVTLVEKPGRINADLSLGADVTNAGRLAANDFIASPGVKLHGDGFIVTPQEAAVLGLGRIAGLENHIRPYRNGRDLADRPRGVAVIDLADLSEEEIRRRFPTVYQRIFERVKPERDANNRATYRKLWWVFGEPRRELRPALYGLARYIATVETAKHRFFEFLDQTILPDNMLVVVASDDAFALGVLSSRVHVRWALDAGGWLGVGNDPRYSKSRCFDPFPFPVASDVQKKVIRALAEELDALRKRVLAEHDFLTLTKLYNVRERLREIEAWERRKSASSSSWPGLSRPSTSFSAAEREDVDARHEAGHDGVGVSVGVEAPAPLSESEKAIHDAGCVGVIHELHRRIDAVVAEAYGWPADLADAEILARLVALNKERAAEERRGLVRWLRPEYQAVRAKQPTAKSQQIEAALEAPAALAPALPKGDVDLFAALRNRLRTAGRPLAPKVLAQQFREGGKAVRRVERGLRLLAAAGVVHRTDAGWFLPSDRGA